jgi:hypothetical protein
MTGQSQPWLARLAPVRLRGVSPRGSKAQEQPMTGQSLDCLAEGNLQHKILAIVEEQRARKAGYGRIWSPTSPGSPNRTSSLPTRRQNSNCHARKSIFPSRRSASKARRMD